MRYQDHLGRQMLRALHTLLDRLQARRAGDDVPPVVLDVTINGAEATTQALAGPPERVRSAVLFAHDPK
jgi:hypothetical protein